MLAISGAEGLSTSSLACCCFAERSLRNQTDSHRFVLTGELWLRAPSRTALQRLLSLQLPIGKKICNIGVHLGLISLCLAQRTLIRLLIEFGRASGIAFRKIKRQYAFGQWSGQTAAGQVEDLCQEICVRSDEFLFSSDPDAAQHASRHFAEHGSRLTILVWCSTCTQRSSSDSGIVRQVEAAGSGPVESASVQSLFAWFEQHTHLANQINKHCEQVKKTAVATWGDSPEGHLCEAASETALRHYEP